jgi:hypothetical protein
MQGVIPIVSFGFVPLGGHCIDGYHDHFFRLRALSVLELSELMILQTRHNLSSANPPSSRSLFESYLRLSASANHTEECKWTRFLASAGAR